MTTPLPHKTYNIMETKLNTIYIVCKISKNKYYIEVLPGSIYETYNCNTAPLEPILEASKRYTYRTKDMIIKEFPDYLTAKADLDKTMIKAGNKRRSIKTTRNSRRKTYGCIKTHKIRFAKKYAGKKTSKKRRQTKYKKGVIKIL